MLVAGPPVNVDDVAGAMFHGLQLCRGGQAALVRPVESLPRVAGGAQRGASSVLASSQSAGLDRGQTDCSSATGRTGRGGRGEGIARIGTEGRPGGSEMRSETATADAGWGCTTAPAGTSNTAQLCAGTRKARRAMRRGRGGRCLQARTRSSVRWQSGRWQRQVRARKVRSRKRLTVRQRGRVAGAQQSRRQRARRMGRVPGSIRSAAGCKGEALWSVETVGRGTVDVEWTWTWDGGCGERCEVTWRVDWVPDSRPC